MQAIDQKRNKNVGSLALLGVLLVFIAVILVLMAVHSPTFFRLNNLINVLVQTSIIGILAIGMCVVMLGGGIDLSMPSVVAFSGIVGALVMRDSQNIYLGAVAMLFCGACFGGLNGFAVAWLKMAPFVVTLASMTILGGASVWITKSASITGYPYEFEDLFLTDFAGIPVSVWIFFLLIIISALMCSSMPFGRAVKAIGFNPKAAFISRLPVNKILCLTYVVSGAMAGITAILLVARLGSASANLASDSLLLDVISACVIGRVSIYGGIGNPLNAAIGALFVTLISNVMNQFGVSYYASLVIKGFIIIAFVYLDKAIRKQQS
ncbi:TPA: ABC transporter permease [Klebsiella pneumoniae]|uniref:ABC transporter permease n=1 Tax=Enterobacteriaceae TaxID=543 RepID=UPI0006578D64|nr:MULTISPECIES: ABC transporter permease [Klebsiella]EKT9721081.1 ABC transporter permease [Klebsiella variicola]HCA9671145.1 ABC transporter permease [Klebsiella variicola subsp. variicola]EKU9431040.1 ABC transporter permease [Klebsiella variicola]ELA0872269.1 ABC transporter permease [Klebsiella variicola]KLY24134.1 hypothetical protein SK92_05565 [Klebsiella oxytoca]